MVDRLSIRWTTVNKNSGRKDRSLDKLHDKCKQDIRKLRAGNARKLHGTKPKLFNGWKSQRGTTDASNALATEANWDSLVNNPVWLDSPFNFNPTSTPGDKAKIVANLLAYTETSYTIQNALGLTGANLIKGAIVLAGSNTPFDNTTFKNLVPILG